MTETILQILIQGGAVGIAMACLYVLYRFLTNHVQHNNDVIANNAAAFTVNAVSMEKLAGSIDDNTKATLKLGDILLTKK